MVSDRPQPPAQKAAQPDGFIYSGFQAKYSLLNELDRCSKRCCGRTFTREPQIVGASIQHESDDRVSWHIVGYAADHIDGFDREIGKAKI